jgi:hypothetical protein
VENMDHYRLVKNDGYTIVREAIDVGELGRLRLAVSRYLAQPGSARYVFGGRVKINPFAFEPEELRGVLANPTLGRALREIAGGPIKFARELGLAQNMLSNWHKDMRGLVSDGNGEEPGVFKLLIYLQDHLGLDDDDFALKVRRGSHLIDDLEEGDEETLFIRSGDAVIMDCRLTHRGQDGTGAPLLARAAVAGVRRLAGAEREFQLRRQVRQLLGRPDRLLITVLYGRCNHWTDDFMKNSRDTEQQRVAGLSLDPPLPRGWQDALESVDIAF